MHTAQLIFDYFPQLTQRQREQFEALYEAYAEWNAKINVISRKDFDSLYLKHILHSLAIARVCTFASGAKVMDVGCGGGFPSVPLAILFPDTEFTAVDSIGKKITVVKGVCQKVGINNLTAINSRVEGVEGKFDYIVSRAVTDMSTFVGWVWNKIARGGSCQLCVVQSRDAQTFGVFCRSAVPRIVVRCRVLWLAHSPMG